jgi:FMN phosphatase YigB (HAD superfamily)
MDIKLISLDIFQTLVDVNSIKHATWQIILKDNYSPGYAEELADSMTNRLIDYFNNEIIEDTTFRPVKSIYKTCYSEIFRKFHIDFDPEEAAKILAEYHNHAKPFYDAEKFVEYIEGKYTYCLSSDTDNDMIKNNQFTQNSHKVFTSESLRTYKYFKENIFFKSVLNHFDYDAREIIHIGDSASDIINPKKLGMKTCWVNRANETWSNEIEPDYICNNLTELMDLL